MDLIEKNKKDEFKYNFSKFKEKLKRNLTLLMAKTFGTKINPEDTKTIQKHPTSGGSIGYYIADPLLQNGGTFDCVEEEYIDSDNGIYIYIGVVGGANNGIGMIQMNIPISEVVADPRGNVAFEKMLLPSFSDKMSMDYWESKEVEIVGKDGLIHGFWLPTFPLGTLTRDERGNFTYSSEIPDILMQKVQENNQKEDDYFQLVEQDSIVHKFGKSIVIADPDCWIKQTKGKITFQGINQDGLFYEYSPGHPVKTEDGKYVYMGSLQIGRARAVEDKENENRTRIIQPYMFRDVVVWTEQIPLVEYFTEKKYYGLHGALGSMFRELKISREIKRNDNDSRIIGGLSLDSEGVQVVDSEIPDSIYGAIDELKKQSKKKTNNVVSINPNGGKNVDDDSDERLN